jgi:predicted HNH restriction endonuclease
MKEYYTEWIDLEFVTDYAATKPNEAFAEVFAHWVIKRNTLGEWTRAFFKEIVRSGGANIREEKNLIDKYLTESVSNQEADDFMNRWKTKLKTYGITHVESSIHFKDQINNKRNVPPITIKELDFVLDGFFKKFGSQFKKDIENVKNHTAKRRGVNKKQLKENEYEFTVKSKSTFVNLVFVLKQDRFKKGTAMILPMTIMRKRNFGTLKGDEVIVERRIYHGFNR